MMVKRRFTHIKQLLLKFSLRIAASKTRNELNP